MKQINSFNLNFCMHKVLKNADETNGRWQGKALEDFCKKPFNRRCLHCLEEKGFVSLISADNDIIFAVIIEAEGITYFSAKQEAVLKFLFKSILVPIAVSLATSIVFAAISGSISAP